MLHQNVRYTAEIIKVYYNNRKNYASCNENLGSMTMLYIWNIAYGGTSLDWLHIRKIVIS